MCVFPLRIQLTMKVLPWSHFLLLLFPVPFSLRSFTNSSWEAEISPDPTSAKPISQHIHQQKHMGEKTEPSHVPATCVCVCVCWVGGEGVAVRGVSPKLVKSGFQDHIPTEIRTRTRKRQVHTGILFTVYTFKVI